MAETSWRQAAHHSGRLPRIAIGGLLHETNTFVPDPTGLDDFASRSLLRGEAMIDAARGTMSSPGGVIEAAAGAARLVPTLFASAMPGGVVEDAAFEALVGELTDRLRTGTRIWPGLDAVILCLHGAMVTESLLDADGEVLDRVRSVVGPDRPVVVVVDSHANLSERMVRAADLIVGFQQYPHTDTKSRGVEAMAHCLNLIANPSRPAPALRRAPILSSLLSQRTGVGTAMGELWRLADRWRSEPSIASISLVPGFPFADVPESGASVLAYAWDQPPHRDDGVRAAGEIASAWWAMRGRFADSGIGLCELPSESDGTTVLAEISDNPGAGGMGDGVHLLRWMLEHDYQHAALATIFDPESVAAAHSAGVGNALTIGIGGKRHPTSGSPVVRRWSVDHLGDGVFANEGAMSTGTVSRIGRTATLRSGSVSVILSEKRTQSLDPSVFRAGGIEPERLRWIAVKSSVHYRAGFGAQARRMLDVECPGLSPSDVQSLEYVHVPRPNFPLDVFDDDGVTGMSGGVGD